MLRLARAQRRREDDDDRDPGRTDRRRTPARSPCSAGAGAATSGSCASGSAFRCRKAGSPKSSPSTRRWSSSAPSTARPRSRAAAADLVARGEARRPRRQALRRAEAEARRRLRARRRPRDPFSRRADDGARSAEPPPALGADRRLKAAGRTVLLTTHYMEEAERLCDRVAIVDHGRIIALGTPRGARSRGLEAPHILEFSTEPPPPTRSSSAVPASAIAAARGHWSVSVLRPSSEAVPALLLALEGAAREARRAFDPPRDAGGRLHLSDRPGAAR